eukprot:TRINITY_DN13147_c0_g2_i1.p1 TRINITY_DN13147_c0_g2~~TRINITY_DN13147_c0_g2_i1.p1  ORF type:complete len:272 (+),score=41.46 TRINITY_DN13147_c0_g2_i1:580-1395(+)
MLLEELPTTSGSESSSRGSSPLRPVEYLQRRRVGFRDEDEQVIVKGTFLDVDTGSSLADRYRLARKCKTDSKLRLEPQVEVYQPGKYSDTVQSKLEDAGEDEDVHPVQDAQPVKDPLSVLAEPQHATRDDRTTVMLKNIPNNYTRSMFLDMLDEHGFVGLYDFVYLPCDFHRDANLGYAFVNVVDNGTVKALWKTFDGFSGWALPTAKVCQVSWSGPHQGLKAHVERYRNSPVMHKSVRDEYKPIIFVQGARQPFPPPTKRVKAPGKTTGR